jgi:hypothetical protein
MRVLAPPRQSGVLNKSLGFDRPCQKRQKREQGGRISPIKPVPVGITILDRRAGGPNTAHPVTQIMSNPYLRLEAGEGKHVAEKTHKPLA